MMKRFKRILYHFFCNIGIWIDIKDFYPNDFNCNYVLVQFMNSDGLLHIPIVARYDSDKLCWIIPYGMTITPNEDIYPICWKNILLNKYYKK